MSLAYYQPPEPRFEREDYRDCETCETETVHLLTAWFKDGPVDCECLSCGSVTEIELD